MWEAEAKNKQQRQKMGNGRRKWVMVTNNGWWRLKMTAMDEKWVFRGREWVMETNNRWQRPNKWVTELETGAGHYLGGGDGCTRSI